MHCVSVKTPTQVRVCLIVFMFRYLQQHNKTKTVHHDVIYLLTQGCRPITLLILLFGQMEGITFRNKWLCSIVGYLTIIVTYRVMWLCFTVFFLLRQIASSGSGLL